MPNRNVRLLISGILISIAAIGCAKKKVEPDSRLSTPVKAYKLWLESAKNGDIPSSILCVTEESKRLFDQQVKGRAAFMEKLAAQGTIFDKYRIADSRSKEDKAVILLEGPKGDTIVVPFKKEAEGWKVDLIAMFSM